MPQSNDFPTVDASDLAEEDCVDLTDEDLEALADGDPLVPQDILGRAMVREEYADHPHSYLCIGTQPDAAHVTLIDATPAYWIWLRLVMLRSVDIAISMGFGPALSDRHMDRAATRLKIGNAQDFAHRHGEQGLRDALQALLPAWEAEGSNEPVFPAELNANLERLAKLIGLDAVETSILGLAVLIYSEQVLNSVQGLFGGIQAHQVPRLFSSMLKIPVNLVEKAFDPNGALARADLLTLDYRGCGELPSRIDLLGGQFSGRMLRQHSSIFGVLTGLVEPVHPPELGMNDYRFMADRLETLTKVLINAQETGRVGVNILLWGRPGLGKSQLARVIAQHVGRELIQVATQTALGTAHSPRLRFKIYRMAQAMFSPKEAFILFDECEEIFNPRGGGPEKDEDAGEIPQKALIHETLENNKIPTIWICNSIADLTGAQIRRFDICLKMEAPRGVHRKEMFDALTGDAMSPELLKTLTQHRQMTPAIMSQTAKLVKMITPDVTAQKRDPLALQLINDKLIATGHPAIKAPSKSAIKFRPQFVNTSMDLDKVLIGLKSHQAGRFLLHGPAGTGKSAFGKWVAEELGIAHLVFRSSALLGKYVGETEENIASAFEQASRESVVLQIDEIDTFLDERTASKNAWQVSMVNEMLSQIEAFEGLLVTTTNLFANIDDAAKRRFDLNLEFGYLRQEDAETLLRETCELFDIHAISAEVVRKARGIGNLTAGDFQQVLGQSRFLQPASADELLLRIMECASAKKFGHPSKMGFLRAAA
jgi:SpoVK/Ycf46/Vps4 family AAA+-type ATPase